jgi:hypothetical protein
MIEKTWLQSRCLEMDGRSDSDIIRLLAARHIMTHSWLVEPLKNVVITFFKFHSFLVTE